MVQKLVEVSELPADLPFEGAGDALMDRQGSCLWAGYGFRSETGFTFRSWRGRWTSRLFRCG